MFATHFYFPEIIQLPAAVMIEPNVCHIVSLETLQREVLHIVFKGQRDVNKIFLMPAFDNSVYDNFVFINLPLFVYSIVFQSDLERILL